MTTDVLDPPETEAETAEIATEQPAAEIPEAAPEEAPAAEKAPKRLTCSKREKAALEIAKRVADLVPTVNAAEAEYIEAKAESDARKKNWEGLQLQLQKVSTELANVLNGGDYQQSLFTAPIPDPHGAVHEEGSAMSSADEGGALDLNCLTRGELARLCGEGCTAEGLTDSKIELIRQACEGNTIADLEAMQRSNSTWNRDIKGFGEKWIDRLQDAHLAIRQRFPIPTEDSTEPASENVNCEKLPDEPEADASNAGTVLDESTKKW